MARYIPRDVGCGRTGEVNHIRGDRDLLIFVTVVSLSLMVCFTNNLDNVSCAVDDSDDSVVSDPDIDSFKSSSVTSGYMRGIPSSILSNSLALTTCCPASLRFRLNLCRSLLTCSLCSSMSAKDAILHVVHPTPPTTAPSPSCLVPCSRGTSTEALKFPLRVIVFNISGGSEKMYNGFFKSGCSSLPAIINICFTQPSIFL